MIKKILSLDEVSQRINEGIGKFKLLSPETGYYIDSQRGKNFFWLEENKIRMNMAFEGTHQPTSFGYFKSKNLIANFFFSGINLLSEFNSSSKSAFVYKEIFL